MTAKSRGSYRPSRKAMARATKIAMLYKLTGNVKAVEQLWTRLVSDLYRDGELSSARSGSDLKSLLAPFRNNLPTLRKAVADMNTGLAGTSKTTGQGVHSQGGTIPSGGEGKPQATADEDEIEKRLFGITVKVIGKKG